MDIPTYTSTIEECGDYYYIPLPQEIVDRFDLKDGDQLEAEVQVGDDVVIVLKKVAN